MIHHLDWFVMIAFSPKMSLHRLWKFWSCSRASWMSLGICFTCFIVFVISLSINQFPFSDFIEKVIILDMVDEMGVGLPHKKIDNLKVSLSYPKRKILCVKWRLKADRVWSLTPWCILTDTANSLLHCLHFSVPGTQWKAEVASTPSLEDAFNTIRWMCFGRPLKPFLESSFSVLAALPSACPLMHARSYLTISNISVILSLCSIRSTAWSKVWAMMAFQWKKSLQFILSEDSKMCKRWEVLTCLLHSSRAELHA